MGLRNSIIARIQPTLNSKERTSANLNDFTRI
jgi:hypothetical protein